jgi:predicted Zn-dependent protease
MDSRVCPKAAVCYLSRFLTICLLLLTCSCASGRRAIPPGEIPQQTSGVTPEDEQYGHEVLNSMLDKYTIDNNDDRINRVRDIVDHLAEAAGATSNPWNVYVLVDDDFKNAAATRGNYIFVWTGILKTVQDDAELATVVSHEMGHVLANHTTPTPQEETSQILSSALGTGAREVVSAQGGYYGALAGLAEALVVLSVNALIVNPEEQRKELEADQIGLFLMAQAGYDPEDAVEFWTRVAMDPDFSGFALQFLSSHPSSEDRVELLRALLPEARQRYLDVKNAAQKPATGAGIAKKKPSSQVTSPAPRTSQSSRAAPRKSSRNEEWKVVEASTSVFRSADPKSETLRQLSTGEKVVVDGTEGRWLHVIDPIDGFVQGRDLTPVGR